MKPDMAVTQSVVRMYRAHPFPNWTREERRHRLAAELCRYKYLGLADAMRGARFLDVGCGTGNRSMLAAKHFRVKNMVGLDASTASLKMARKVAKEEDFEAFIPVKAHLFDLPYEAASFDVVVSWGVLHHTVDPLRGLREMVRVCRPGGYVGLFVYNKWNHWRHNMQKRRVDRLAGEDFEKRFEVAHQLFGKKTVAEMTPEEIALFYDQYCHPYKSDHTLGEIQTWLGESGLEYWGSFPPIRFRDALDCVRYRAHLLDAHPVRNWYWTRILKSAAQLPRCGSGPPFKRPRSFHRIFWQALYAWMGRHGDYSGAGAALAARKPE